MKQTTTTTEVMKKEEMVVDQPKFYWRKYNGDSIQIIDEDMKVYDCCDIDYFLSRFDLRGGCKRLKKALSSYDPEGICYSNFIGYEGDKYNVCVKRESKRPWVEVKKILIDKFGYDFNGF